MSEQLARRGHQQSIYVAALEELLQRGWITQDGDMYRLTATGQDIRDTAEQQTNKYFYRPWSIPEPEEMVELLSLLEQLVQDAVPSK